MGEWEDWGVNHNWFLVGKPTQKNQKPFWILFRGKESFFSHLEGKVVHSYKLLKINSILFLITCIYEWIEKVYNLFTNLATKQSFITQMFAEKIKSQNQPRKKWRNRIGQNEITAHSTFITKRSQFHPKYIQFKVGERKGEFWREMLFFFFLEILRGKVQWKISSREKSSAVVRGIIWWSTNQFFYMASISRDLKNNINRW